MPQMCRTKPRLADAYRRSSYRLQIACRWLAVMETFKKLGDFGGFGGFGGPKRGEYITVPTHTRAVGDSTILISLLSGVCHHPASPKRTRVVVCRFREPIDRGLDWQGHAPSIVRWETTARCSGKVPLTCDDNGRAGPTHELGYAIVAEPHYDGWRETSGVVR
ncbi:hypothetical protein K504DRAFT_464615 [Pleomassaria siparia CBS 279.74]|uniref:Uncharacterized protein n=1 Tax=Pleomassaria siparia CBS 279.74 TaxID=1314801 RepID=A0A6G1KI59_9PLEO|nr:hypothetical protein K504DRAFT_464615 [Pleomassaria siparia CBS 279.74]